MVRLVSLEDTPAVGGGGGRGDGIGVCRHRSPRPLPWQVSEPGSTKNAVARTWHPAESGWARGWWGVGEQDSSRTHVLCFLGSSYPYHRHQPGVYCVSSPRESWGPFLNPVTTLSIASLQTHFLCSSGLSGAAHRPLLKIVARSELAMAGFLRCVSWTQYSHFG